MMSPEQGGRLWHGAIATFKNHQNGKAEVGALALIVFAPNEAEARHLALMAARDRHARNNDGSSLLEASMSLVVISDDMIERAVGHER